MDRIGLVVGALGLVVAIGTPDAGTIAAEPGKAGAEADAGSSWALPESGSCEPSGGLRRWPDAADDAGQLVLRSGADIPFEQMEMLRDYLPGALWENREKFFFEGMRLLIGPCFADYGSPQFYADATRKFSGEARLTEVGGLDDYTAGLPFDPERISETEPDAGMKWAWNFEHRYQASGFSGDFRTSDMVGRMWRAEPFIGEIFKFQFAFRSDRADRDYQAPGSEKHWVSGGLMKEPFDARHYAWRQYRDVEHLAKPGRSDDIHAYLPDLRRVRRVAASGVEGLYMPSFNVGAVKPTVIAATAGGLGAGASGAGAVSDAGASLKTKRSGFEGLELRPLLYDFRLVGVHDVLAPINSTVPSYPEANERDFGPWGLSFASDTWDLRRALLLDGKSRNDVGGDQVARLVLYVDLQTLYPLYYMSWDSRGEPIDVGMFVGRWSETRADYPRWPDDPAREIRVIDPVGAAFANLQEQGGWRRESWTVVSTPPSDRTVKKMLSVNNLTKRH